MYSEYSIDIFYSNVDDTHLDTWSRYCVVSAWILNVSLTTPPTLIGVWNLQLVKFFNVYLIKLHKGGDIQKLRYTNFKMVLTPLPPLSQLVAFLRPSSTQCDVTNLQFYISLILRYVFQISFFKLIIYFENWIFIISRKLVFYFPCSIVGIYFFFYPQ